MEENAPPQETPPIVAAAATRQLNLILWPTFGGTPTGVAPVDAPLGLKVPGFLRQCLTGVAENVARLPQQVALLGEPEQVKTWLLSAHERCIRESFDGVCSSLAEAITPPPATAEVEAEEEAPDYHQRAVSLLEQAKFAAEAACYGCSDGESPIISMSVQAALPLAQPDEGADAAHKFARIFAKKYPQLDKVFVSWVFRPADLTDPSNIHLLGHLADAGCSLQYVCPLMPAVPPGEFGPRDPAEALNFCEDFGEGSILATYPVPTQP